MLGSQSLRMILLFKLVRVRVFAFQIHFKQCLGIIYAYQ
ncbi:hypothetical protein SLEP1_g35416 [Rubroshorea leprosula]|uniref:Uncharacterized protein n=1 Tax=Rubroshorea leprosula TaxID=152421 RepID=A0AAV5KN52_9ROSI|nr:hypothetical protein SLEP1_g35416 [Rubroshorea leprosula]